MKKYNLIGIAVSLAVVLGSVYLFSYTAGKAWKNAEK